VGPRRGGARLHAQHPRASRRAQRRLRRRPDDSQLERVDARESFGWDPHIQVTSVGLTAGVNRRYQVEHAGRSAELAPGAPSAAFAGLALQGDWRLSTALAAGEACGRNVPRSLIIDFASACTRCGCGRGRDGDG
jgi:hypothetical protein